MLQTAPSAIKTDGKQEAMTKFYSGKKPQALLCSTCTTTIATRSRVALVIDSNEILFSKQWSPGKESETTTQLIC